jgi:hypothetical protein
MPVAIVLTLGYLAMNLAVMVWLEYEHARGRVVSGRVRGVAAVLRYGPPLAGVIYLVVVSGDWLFVGFVIAFFVGAGWLMNGMLAYTDNRPDGPGRTRNDR